MKNFIILGVIAVVALGGFIYFTFLATPAHELASEAEDTAAALSRETATTPAAPEPKKGTGTLESIRLLNEDLECTISTVAEGQQSTGTYFVSGGSMRGDFLTDSPDLTGQVLSSMIIDAGMMYVWSEIEGGMYGVKMDLAQAAAPEATSREPVSRNAAVEYDCKPWTNVDRTVFMPPTSVLFQDMSQMMRGGMEYGTLYEGMEGEVPELP
ncbi:MAG: hypothetical protein KBC35_01310 [Candidatus Pacebacteria bacterium]|jgi:hypothetical protein|nr:hypothetical protein [Candidatus Paceibacterota bacterium]